MEILNWRTYQEKIDRLPTSDDLKPYWKRSYKSRWCYFKEIINEINKLTNGIDNPKILELGAFCINFTDVSDNIDININYIDYDNVHNEIYIMDLREEKRWDIPDKHYDLVIASQIFEHLEGHQLFTFNEIKRVSKKAIITIPYKWNSPNDKMHHNITTDHFDKWTDNFMFNEQYAVRCNNLLRLFRIYEF